MSNPVLITDLEARFRPLSPTEQTTAQALLDDAWVILLSQRPGLQAQMDSDITSVGLVRAVVAAMVLRVLRNPEGWVQEAVDDWSGRRGEATASGALYVSDTELSLLNGGATSEAFTIRPSGTVTAYPPDPWVTLP